MAPFLIIAGMALLPVGVAQADTMPPHFPEVPYATTTMALVARYSELYGVSEPDMTRVLACESGLLEDAVGDQGHSYGIAQIYLPAHPEITKKEALDKEFSIRWMAEQFYYHHQALWSCWK